MTIKIKQVNVTPDMARTWLESNYEGQRHLRHLAVKRYANDMRCGNWEATGDPVKFDENGKLIDGQHRAAAVVEAGVTVPMFVAEGVPVTAFPVLDQGVPRTFASLLEGASVPYASTVAAATRQVYIYARFRDFYRKGGSGTQSMPDLLAFYDQVPGLSDMATVGAGLGSQFKLSHGMIAAILYVADVGKGGDVPSFVEQWKTGENLTRDNPVHYLREQLYDRLSMRPDRRRSPGHYSALITRAWNAFAREELVAEFMKGRVAGKSPLVYDPHGFIDERWPQRG